jgi:alkylation response protein AidB-like acyl-CoA dehydrogenase
MFTMMNAARLAVGMQGYAQGAIACQTAAAFARERLQGRAATGARNPEGAADPIIVHPDVRRNLMHQRSFIEGARALAFWGAQMIDAARRAGDAEADAMVKTLRNWVSDHIGPIAKPDDIRFADGLPKTRSGKIMRRILRKIAENELDALGDTDA